MSNNTNNIRTFSVARIVMYAIAAAILLSLVGNVIAKYTFNTQGQTLVVAQEFYFRSDILSETAKTHTLSSNTTELNIKLMNHADDLRYSDSTLEYTVSLSEGGTVVATKNGFLTGNSVSTATVSFPVESGKTYTVTATGDAGYIKTLSATIVVLPKDNKLFKSVENTNAYVALTVWSQDVSGNLTVDFPDGVIPDNTDDAMRDVLTSDGEFTDSTNFSETYSSHTYRFFKTSIGTVSADAFDVECDGAVALVKTPDK